jgi:hypothetical protein
MDLAYPDSRFGEGEELVRRPIPRGPQPGSYQTRLTPEQQRRAKWQPWIGGLMGAQEGGLGGLIAGAMEGRSAYEDRKRYQNYVEDLAGEAVPGSQQHQALMARRYAGEPYSGTSRPWWASQAARRRGTYGRGTHSVVDIDVGEGMTEQRLLQSGTGQMSPIQGAERAPKYAPKDPASPSWRFGFRPAQTPEGQTGEWEQYGRYDSRDPDARFIPDLTTPPRRRTGAPQTPARPADQPETDAEIGAAYDRLVALKPIELEDWNERLHPDPDETEQRPDRALQDVVDLARKKRSDETQEQFQARQRKLDAMFSRAEGLMTRDRPSDVEKRVDELEILIGR